MNIVFQENDYDCGAACLAMALGMKKSSDIWPALGFNPCKGQASKGICDMEVLSVLERMGKAYRYERSAEGVAEDWDADMTDMAERLGLPSARHMRDKLAATLTGCALVVVKSLNGGGMDHFVYVKRGEVYDPMPAPHNRYVGTAYSLTPLVVIYVLD